jgi:O-antigen ligase
MKIYKTGLDMFIENPVFGVGVGHAYLEFLNSLGAYFHSTLVQVGATTGIIGIISYGFLYYYRAKKLLDGGSTLGIFSFVGLFLFFLYALIDNGDFNVVLIYATLMITVIGLAKEKGDSLPPLFLKFNKITFYNQFCK